MLHVVVGHGLPGYFLNAVRSVRALAPADRVLVIDNASPSEPLRQELRQIAAADDLVDVILRSANNVTANRKVGSLYAAYGLAFEYALARDYDFLHILQADCQLLWWDDEVVTQAAELFTAHPRCLNIRTLFLCRHEAVGAALRTSHDGITALSSYGLSDTGLYHLGRWQAEAMRFGTSEPDHAKRYLDEGFEVLCHPCPTDAPIPWPAVVRRGVQRGSEVRTRQPFLLKPLPPEMVASVRNGSGTVWLEDVCMPWGWTCLTPMWATDLQTADYWALRYADMKRNGLRRALPRFEFRGVSAADRRWPLPIYRYRPSLLRLYVLVPLREIARRAALVGRSSAGH